MPFTTECVLQYVDDHAAEIVAELVRIPSVSGSDEESTVQHLLAARMAEIGMDVDACGPTPASSRSRPRWTSPRATAAR